eukprot:Opistho-2@47391
MIPTTDAMTAAGCILRRASLVLKGEGSEMQPCKSTSSDTAAAPVRRNGYDMPMSGSARRSSTWDAPIAQIRRSSVDIRQFASRSLRNLSVEIASIIVAPTRLFRTFCVPDVCLRWWDIDYQARGYGLLHVPFAHYVHMVAFTVMIAAMFAGNIAASNGVAPLGLATLTLLSWIFYQRNDAPTFRIAVIIAWIALYALGQLAVAVVTPAVILNWQITTIAASAIALVGSHLTDEAPPFINFQVSGPISFPTNTASRQVDAMATMDARKHFRAQAGPCLLPHVSVLPPPGVSRTSASGARHHFHHIFRRRRGCGGGRRKSAVEPCKRGNI